MDSGGFGSDVPGANGFDKEKDNVSKWYTRWYVWVLLALVLIGLLVANFAK